MRLSVMQNQWILTQYISIHEHSREPQHTMRDEEARGDNLSASISSINVSLFKQPASTYDPHIAGAVAGDGFDHDRVHEPGWDGEAR